MPTHRFASLRGALGNRLAALAAAGTMRAIREGMLWLMPCLLTSAAFQTLVAVGQLLGWPAWLVVVFDGLHSEIARVLPWMAGGSIGYMLAVRHRLPRLSAAFLCATNVALAAYLLREHPTGQVTWLWTVAIVGAPLAVNIMAWLHRQRWTRLTQDDAVDENVREALNMVVPGVLTCLLLSTTIALLETWSPVAIADLLPRFPHPDAPYSEGALLAAANSLLWFLGIHGSQALNFAFASLNGAAAVNAGHIASGLPAPNLLTMGLFSTFGFIGGAGSTLPLALAILLFCRTRAMRLVALASLPCTIFNINEILLFGLPLILNPRLLVPFMLVPACNVVIAMSAIERGWIGADVMPQPFTSPVLLNAYLGSGNDPAAILLQVALIGLGICLYAPWVRAQDRELRRSDVIRIDGLETIFSRLHQEARLLTHDELTRSRQLKAKLDETAANMRRISEYSFHLEYQPLVSARTGQCTGCEALLRARDRDGTIRPPWQFLQWLKDAGLMCDVDLWVATMATRQHRQWREQGTDVPITINVTGPTLTSPRHRDRLVAILADARGRVSVEVTEDALIDNVPAMRAAVEQLHAIGSKLYLDDFGTGYSALSYLQRFKVDAVKLDRSFVQGLADAQGARMMAGLLRLCETLDLQIIVEGVETQGELDAINQCADVIVQGWYYSRSLLPDDLAAFVFARNVATH